MLERQVSATGIVYYISPLLRRAGVPHGFSTRIGGVSVKPFDSLNLGNPAGIDVQDEWERIHENYRRLQVTLDLAGKQRCWVHQVHGADAVFVRKGHEFSSGARADVIIGDDPARVLTIRVADCVPILLASADGTHVAAVHAGWRGVIAGAVSVAVRELRRETSADLLAAIGPCIGREAFEVGSDVLDQFVEHFGSSAPVERTPNGSGHADLRKAVEIQLTRAGIAPDAIDRCDHCTFRDSEEFYSHRRDRGITGRLAALIAPRK